MSKTTAEQRAKWRDQKRRQRARHQAHQREAQAIARLRDVILLRIENARLRAENARLRTPTLPDDEINAFSAILDMRTKPIIRVRAPSRVAA